EDVQRDDDSDPSSKSAAEDGDVDLSDASEPEQIRPPLATELDMEPTLREYLDAAAEEKLRSYDTNAEPSTKSEKTVRDNSTKPVILAEIPSIILDPPPLIRHQEIAEPHIADLGSNLEKKKDTVASTEAENVELEERWRAYWKSLAGTTPGHWRDHTAQDHHTENGPDVDREVDHTPLIAIAGQIDRPKEERLEHIEPLVSTSKSRTSDLHRSAAESGRSIQAEDPVEENRLPHATEYDQAKYLDGSPIPNDSFPKDGSHEALGSDLSDRNDGLLLSPQYQQPILPYTNAPMVIPKAAHNKPPPPLPSPRYIPEWEHRVRQRGPQENIMLNDQAEQMREEQLAVTREDAFKNEPAVESPHASNVDQKRSVGTSESTRVLPTGSGPTLPSSQADRRQPEDRGWTSRIRRDLIDDRFVEAQLAHVSSSDDESDEPKVERRDINALMQSGDATVISNGNNEIRLKVDPNAMLNLQFNGDKEGRTIQFIPTEDGMAELVVRGPEPENESTYDSTRRPDRVLRAPHDDRIVEVPRPLRRRANTSSYYHE
ncbi:hypothetical protein J4E83_002882, partial [Alternaria metachromatica]|uniref:uncharacterized protein n=1 Tax=Alternaria metachromatica TaxID=283354 RepID=UPI0020C29861